MIKLNQTKFLWNSVEMHVSLVSLSFMSIFNDEEILKTDKTWKKNFDI